MLFAYIASACCGLSVNPELISAQAEYLRDSHDSGSGSGSDHNERTEAREEFRRRFGGAQPEAPAARMNQFESQMKDLTYMIGELKRQLATQRAQGTGTTQLMAKAFSLPCGSCVSCQQGGSCPCGLVSAIYEDLKAGESYTKLDNDEQNMANFQLLRHLNSILHSIIAKPDQSDYVTFQLLNNTLLKRFINRLGFYV
ncbi:hypothetical protein PAPHI01_2440 [Pancytospora philotis]|nr:hypothetical protein PAPHI01_2440 [Pancytospora philotis]